MPPRNNVFARAIPYAEKDVYKAYSGVYWDPERRTWMVPLEVRTEYELAERKISCADRLLPFQTIAVQRALQDGVGFMFNFDTGCGKSYAAMGTCHELAAQHVLIVCPPMVVEHWRALTTEWGYTPAVVGEEHADLGSDVVLVSYHQLSSIVAAQLRYDAIILDESHKIKNGAKGKLENAPAIVRYVHQLRDASPQAFRMLLTATMFPNKPDDGWAQLDWVWPGRFGTYWKYVARYHEITHEKIPNTEKTKIVIGPPRNTEELRDRLRWCSMVVTKGEVPGLPPWDACMEDDWESALNTLDSTSWVLTDTRDRVEFLAQRYPNLIAFHGAASIKKRHALISEAKASGRPVVSTMHSVREGIDLTHWNRVLYDQLSWTMLAIVQSMGRFHRLSSKNPVQYLFNGADRRRARVLVRKLQEIRAIIPTTLPLEEYIQQKYDQETLEAELAAVDFGGEEWAEA